MKIRATALAAASLVAAAGAVAWTLTPPAEAHATAATAVVDAATYEIDPVHSYVLFNVDHLGVGTNWGRFNKQSGDFRFDADTGELQSINIVIDATSVDTGNEARDRHLRSPDFFSTEEFPTITYTADSIRKVGEGKYVADGKMTFMGVTKPLQTEIELVGAKDTGRQGFKAGLDSRFTFNRSDYGMSWGVDNGSLGDEIEVFVSLEGARK